MTLSASATLSGGNLTVAVAGLSETLTISQPAPNTLTLTDPAGTTYHGTTAASQTITGVTRDVTIKLNGGTDSLQFDETKSISLGAISRSTAPAATP